MARFSDVRLVLTWGVKKARADESAGVRMSVKINAFDGAILVSI